MQIELFLILQIVFAHWVSDFVLQSGWMATNKSHNWSALAAHVVTYTVSMATIMLIFITVTAYINMNNTGLYAVLFAFFPVAVGYFIVMWAVINGVLHFITDAITSRITSKLWQKNDMHNFFVVVGLDQLVHYACLFITMIALTNW